MSINISLPSYLEELVKQKVESGRYTSASEVIREALRFFEKYEKSRIEKLEILKAHIQEGMDSGEPTPLDMQAIKSEARRTLS